ncbi:MAG TPA: hypothetical protein VFS44_05510 [Gemmatimonadaceae bacterium]|nr:hypothetical protein [Gemmatimonadaceae bacterium]
MIGRPYVVVMLAALAGATALPAQGRIAYAPGARRYHLISVVTRSQEVNGQKSDFKLTNEQQVSVNLSAHGKDTLDFAYTIDSSRIASDPPVPLPDVAKMQGMKVSGTMSPLGKVFTITSSRPTDDPDAKVLMEGMGRFLIALPRGAKVGSTWTDTLRNVVNHDGNDIATSTITTSKIVGDTTFAGEKAWRVQRTSVLTLKGTQNQNGQQLRVEGNGTASSMYYLGAAGAYLGSAGEQHMQMTIDVPGSGPVPMVQSVTSKVELVP